MAARSTRFIVLSLSDRDEYGFDETALPLLCGLMDAASPDHRQSWHAGVTGYFLTSADALARVRRLLEEAERLSASNGRFGSLGIGLGEGPLMAEFSLFGRLKHLVPIGSVVNESSRSARTPGAWRQVLQSITEELGGGGGLGAG